MSVVLASLTGAIGALCRYGVGGLVQRGSRSTFPVGTMTVNLVGALLAGMVAGAVATDSTAGIAALGFLGGFTTFSTWMVESVGLGLRAGVWWRVLANLTLSLAGGILLAFVGYSLFS